jgi:hypothetical protein
MGFSSRFCGASAAEAYATPNSPFCLGRHSLAKDYSASRPLMPQRPGAFDWPSRHAARHKP